MSQNQWEQAESMGAHYDSVIQLKADLAAVKGEARRLREALRRIADRENCQRCKDALADHKCILYDPDGFYHRCWLEIAKTALLEERTSENLH